MSIPKEPRQLMINLMYLVLTALLALNVSAEIFNAFKVVDKGLVASNASLDASNEALPNEIATLAKKEAKYATYAQRAPQVRAYSKEVTDYIDGIVKKMIDESGGYNEKGELKGAKNKDVTTRFLCGPEPEDNKGEGGKLEQKIIEARAKFMSFVDADSRTEVDSKISLNVDDAWKKSKDKKNWAQFNFQQMPLAATLPIFSKIKNDVKSAEAAVLNHYMEKVGGKDVVFNKFRVFSSPKSAYIIKGDKFETEISLGATSSNISGMSISVNGQNLPIVDGGAKWSTTPGSTGVQKYSAAVNVKNPVTGEVTSARGEFEFEVGTRAANVSADKMNTFYIGVDNPISVSAQGVSSNQLKVTGSGGGISLSPAGGNKYNARVTTPGSATVTLSGGGLPPTNFEFRVKRIPDPIAKIGKSKGGGMGNGEFKVQDGLIAALENFDFDAKCEIAGYEFTYIAKRQDPVSYSNVGGRFSGDSRRIQALAKPGDTYYFNNIRARCPGDAAGRDIGTMVVTIK